MKTNTRLYSVLNYTVRVWVCRRFGLSTFWSVDVLLCRCFNMSMFWFVDALVCRRFGLSTFRCVDVSAYRRFGCRRFALTKFWPVTYKRMHFNTSKPGYKYGNHFADDIYSNGFLEFFVISLSMSFTSQIWFTFCLHRLDIINIFPTFKYFNTSFSPLMPRIKYRTCILKIRCFGRLSKQRQSIFLFSGGFFF